MKSYLTTESDPVFNGSAAKIITAGNISNWNNAYSWGNHASAGYVPGTRTITINGTSLNLSDNRSWNVGTVTSIATGNGITGGTISTAGTIGLTGQSLALHNLGTNGLITRTAAGTLASRTIIAGNGITVSNGNGVSGNPTIAANFGTTATTVAAGNHTHANATTSASGFMSAADKTKIDGLTTYAVGNAAHGGVVFWVDATGQHGLVCAIFDQSTGIRWDAGTLTWTLANGDGPFAGAMNTAIIIANQGRGDGSLYAARICNQLQMTIGGKTYGDWYLPSKEELNLMFVNRSIISDMCLKLGGSAFNTSTGYYYSSTEYSMDKAWGHAFHSGGYQSVNTKFGKARVRAIRAF